MQPQQPAVIRRSTPQDLGHKRQLSKDFMENISTFFVPCGHKLYMDKREKIEHDYWQVPRKGVKVRSREHRTGRS